MILVIDTSTDKNYLALFWPEKIEKEIFWQRQETSKELLPKIDQFLRQNKLKLKDLKAIAVFRGPGSFTGLRVGISVAQSLGYALKIPVFGFKQKDILKGVKKVFQKIKRGRIEFGLVKPIYK